MGKHLPICAGELHDLRRLLGEDESLEITSGQLRWHDRGRHDIDLSTFLCAVRHRPGSAIRTSTTLSQPPETAGNATLRTGQRVLPSSPLQRGSSPVTNLQQQTAATKAQLGGGECDYWRLARRKRRTVRPTPPLASKGLGVRVPLAPP